jgi:chitinase
LDAEQYGLTQTNITALMRAANTRRTPVLVSVGGDGTLDGFRGATSPARLDVFTTNLVNFLSNNGAGYGGFPGYAGIDVAWTPMQSPTAGNPGAPDDRPQYRAFITTLRGKLDALTPRPLLYASAVREQPALFAELQASFDQVNVRAYELAGPWPGQVTWHNSAVRSGGGTFPDPPRDPLPSIDGCIQPFLAAGVPASKLGLGLIFYGKHWLGVTQPQQRWTQPPVVEDIPFSDIMNCYHHDAYYRWDEAAQAAYLSISDSIWIKDCFISYDNEMSIQKKIDYAEQHRLGVFIWELGGGWRLGGGTEPGQGLPDYLLRFVKSSTRWVTDNRPPFFANPDKETL